MVGDIAAIRARTIPALARSRRLRRVYYAISGQTRIRHRSWLTLLPSSEGLISTTQKLNGFVLRGPRLDRPTERHRPNEH